MKINEITNEGWKGALAGAALGSLAGPAGTIIGGTAGYWLGDKAHKSSLEHKAKIQKFYDATGLNDKTISAIISYKKLNNYLDAGNVIMAGSYSFDSDGLINPTKFYHAIREILEDTEIDDLTLDSIIGLTNSLNDFIKNNKSSLSKSTEVKDKDVYGRIDPQ